FVLHSFPTRRSSDLIFIAEGVSSFLFNGIWLINGFVNRGELDRFLLRPVSPLLQVMSSAFGLNGIVNIILGLVFLLESINKTDRSEEHTSELQSREK